METLKEAKQHLRDNFEKGVACPCCEGFVKLYKRKLNSGMALFLIGLYKLAPISHERGQQSFFSNKEIMAKMNINTSSLDYSVLKHFGLIEPRVAENGHRDSGHWRITYDGISFVGLNGIVPKYVYLYKNKLQKTEGEITIQEALGNKFDYKELMK